MRDNGGGALLIDILRLLVFPALMAFAAASDLLTMRISNRIPLFLIAGFAALAFGSGMMAADVAAHVAAGLVVLIVAFAFFAFGWIGGGDAKLAAAVALWFGWDLLLPFVLYSSVLGGALTLLIMQARQFVMPSRLACHEWVQRLQQQDAGIPYGIALAAAALIIYPDSAFMKSFGG